MSARIDRDAIRVGDRVSYEDMANPLRFGMVVEIPEGPRWFRVRWDGDGLTTSDLRQQGWKLVAQNARVFYAGKAFDRQYNGSDGLL